MNLQDLLERGALVQTPPTPRDVTWLRTDPKTGQTEPVTFTVLIKSPSSGWLDRARTAAARAGNDRISYQSAIIAHAVLFGEDGTQHFTYEQADMLQDSLALALMDAYNAVNSPPIRPLPEGADKREEFAKNSGPTPGSGTNSSESASAAEPSPTPGGN